MPSLAMPERIVINGWASSTSTRPRAAMYTAHRPSPRSPRRRLSMNMSPKMAARGRTSLWAMLCRWIPGCTRDRLVRTIVQWAALRRCRMGKTTRAVTVAPRVGASARVRGREAGGRATGRTSQAPRTLRALASTGLPPRPLSARAHPCLARMPVGCLLVWGRGAGGWAPRCPHPRPLSARARPPSETRRSSARHCGGREARGRCGAGVEARFSMFRRRTGSRRKKRAALGAALGRHGIGCT